MLQSRVRTLAGQCIHRYSGCGPRLLAVSLRDDFCGAFPDVHPLCRSTKTTSMSGSETAKEKHFDAHTFCTDDLSEKHTRASQQDACHPARPANTYLVQHRQKCMQVRVSENVKDCLPRQVEQRLEIRQEGAVPWLAVSCRHACSSGPSMAARQARQVDSLWSIGFLGNIKTILRRGFSWGSAAKETSSPKIPDAPKCPTSPCVGKNTNNKTRVRATCSLPVYGGGDQERKGRVSRAVLESNVPCQCV